MQIITEVQGMNGNVVTLDKAARTTRHKCVTVSLTTALTINSLLMSRCLRFPNLNTTLLDLESILCKLQIVQSIFIREAFSGV